MKFHTIGVWEFDVKGFVNMTKVSDKSDQSQYLEISWFMGFRGFGASTSRIFVALFDYDPPTMSPNPDACDEELPFREGQLIKVRPEFSDKCQNSIKLECLQRIFH